MESNEILIVCENPETPRESVLQLIREALSTSSVPFEDTPAGIRITPLADPHEGKSRD